MTKEATLHTIVLKNIDTTNAASGLEVMNIIVTEAMRRPHLRRGVQSTQWDRERGIGILVDDAGVRDHLANALDFVTKGQPNHYRTQFGTGHARTGTIAGFAVTIWNLEP